MMRNAMYPRLFSFVFGLAMSISCGTKSDNASHLKIAGSTSGGQCTGFLYQGTDCHNSLVAGDANQCTQAGCVWYSGGPLDGCYGKIAVNCSFFTTAQACNGLSRVCSWSAQ